MKWRCALGFHELHAWNWPTYSDEPVAYNLKGGPTWYSWRECLRCGACWLRDQSDGLAPPEWKRVTAAEYHQHIGRLRRERSKNGSGGIEGDADWDNLDDVYQSPFVEINERVDVGEALIELVRQLDRLPDYRYAWRWACSALHAAVQAAVVVSIAGSAKIGAMKPKEQAKWMAAYDEQRWADLPDERTDDFMPLYTRMKEQLGYDPGEEVDDDIRRLHSLRNHLGHIRPSSLLVHPIDLIAMTRNCLSVVSTC
jgi:hypothetical protein